MKGILEFDLPEDRDEFNTAVKAVELSYVVSEMRARLRSILKHENHSDEVFDMVESIQGTLNSLTEDLGIFF